MCQMIEGDITIRAHVTRQVESCQVARQDLTFDLSTAPLDVIEIAVAGLRENLELQLRLREIDGSADSLPAPTPFDDCHVWLELGAAGVTDRSTQTHDIPMEFEEFEAIMRFGASRVLDALQRRLNA